MLTLRNGAPTGVVVDWEGGSERVRVLRERHAGMGPVRERELTEREPYPNKRTNNRNVEAGKRRKEKGQEGGKAERRSKGEEKGEHRREEGGERTR